MRTLKNILLSMRPEQWTKNLIVFAGLFFGTGFKSLSALFLDCKIFAIFCLVSSGSYILNDLVDRNEDKLHPEKRHRPIAAGRLRPAPAILACVLLIFVGLFMAWSIYFKLFLLVAGFLLLHIFYDFSLKHIAVVDVFVIAFAFIIRLFSGVMMSPIENRLSSWILLCTFLLALFLALCKRRAEIAMLQDASKHHRKSLADYSIQFIDQMIAIMGGCTIISYSIYALSAETVAKRGTDKLIYTIPFVVYGIFRYLYLVNIKMGGTNPEKLLLRDVPLLVDILLYCVVVYAVLYVR